MATTILDHGTLKARRIETTDTLAVSQSRQLRHRYFVETKNWVMPNSNDAAGESDHYDDFAYHLGIFENGKLLAYLRALPWGEERGFMLEHDFRCLLSDEALADLHRTQSWEISRLVLAPDLSPDAVMPVTELLFKLLYQLGLQHQIERLYAVVEPGWLRRFQRCFHLPFRALGSSHRFPDGTRAVAAHASLRDLESSLQEADPLKLHWYQEGQKDLQQDS